MANNGPKKDRLSNVSGPAGVGCRTSKYHKHLARLCPYRGGICTLRLV